MDNTGLLRRALKYKNLKEVEMVDALENDGNASVPEQVKRPNPWEKEVMMNFLLLLLLLLLILLPCCTLAS